MTGGRRLLSVALGFVLAAAMLREVSLPDGFQAQPLLAVAVVALLWIVATGWPVAATVLTSLVAAVGVVTTTIAILGGVHIGIAPVVATALDAAAVVVGSFAWRGLRSVELQT